MGVPTYFNRYEIGNEKYKMGIHIFLYINSSQPHDQIIHCIISVIVYIKPCITYFFNTLVRFWLISLRFYLAENFTVKFKKKKKNAILFCLSLESFLIAILYIFIYIFFFLCRVKHYHGICVFFTCFSSGSF